MRGQTVMAVGSIRQCTRARMTHRTRAWAASACVTSHGIFSKKNRSKSHKMISKKNSCIKPFLHQLDLFLEIFL